MLVSAVYLECVALMSPKTGFKSPPAMDFPLSRHILRGFSTIELLVVIVILGSLAALAYRSYMTSVKINLSTNQMLTIEDRIKTDFELTLNGVDSGLRLPGSDQPITAMSTCRDFLTSGLPPTRTRSTSRPPSPIRASAV